MILLLTKPLKSISYITGGKKMEVKSVCYDVNGTIIDDTAHFLNAINRIFGVFDLNRLPIEELKQRFGQPWTRIYREEGITGSMASEKELYILYNRFYSEGLHKLQPFEGLKNCLKFLARQGLPLFIVSTQQNTITLPFLRFHNLAHFFLTIEGGVSDKAEALVKIASEQKLDIAKMAYIGDQEQDMLHAINAGCIPIGFGSGLHDKKRLLAAGAKTIIMTHREFIDIF